jgi:hypothetical protein
MTTKQPDWEAIERAYRAGMLSLRAMAEQFGSKESTIRSRASKNGWKMDLTAQVKAATKEKLSRSTSRTTVAQSDVREDAQIIEEASDVAASIVLSHRTDLAQWRGIANKLRDALDELSVRAKVYLGHCEKPGSWRVRFLESFHDELPQQRHRWRVRPGCRLRKWPNHDVQPRFRRLD